MIRFKASSLVLFGVAITFLGGCGSDGGKEDAIDTGLPDAQMDSSDADVDAPDAHDASDAQGSVFEDFTVSSCIKSNEHLTIFAESSEPRGCVQISFAKTGDSESFDIDAPDGWQYTSSSVDATICSVALSVSLGPEASDATGNLAVEFDASDSPARANSNLNLLFPADSNNPYSGRVLIQGTDIEVLATCPVEADNGGG